MVDKDEEPRTSRRAGWRKTLRKTAKRRTWGRTTRRRSAIKVRERHWEDEIAKTRRRLSNLTCTRVDVARWTAAETGVAVEGLVGQIKVK